MTPIARTPHDPGLYLALAPMDGITDAVYRELLTDLFAGRSGISLCVSEFVRVTNHPVIDAVLRRHCPELDRGGHTRSGVPVFLQLLGGQPEPMAHTARRACELGASGVDLNFGCPAKVVNNHDGGAALLRQPCRVQTVTAAVREAMPPEVPLTVKIRIGWDSGDAIAEIARAAEAGGASWITIHGRTRTQLYRPPVDWHAIGRAREAVGIPVVANGDLNTPADVERCAARSGCDAFMIGRGAMARPALFRRIRGSEDPDLDLPWLCDRLLDYRERLLAAGAGESGTLGRIKQWLRLGAPAFAELDTAFQRIKRAQSLAEGTELLQQARAGHLTRGNVDLHPRGADGMQGEVGIF